MMVFVFKEDGLLSGQGKQEKTRKEVTFTGDFERCVELCQATRYVQKC